MAAASQRKPLGLQIFLSAFVVIWLIMAAFPFIWTLWGSFKVELDFFSIADWTNANVDITDEGAVVYDFPSLRV